MDPKTSLIKASDSDPGFEQNLYQHMIGSLMYLVTCTRADLAFSLSYLSRFSSHPLERHHTAVKVSFVILLELVLCLLSTSVILLQFLCLLVPSRTLTMLLVVIPGVPYLVILVCQMVVRYPGSLRNRNPLPLLPQKQNMWPLPLHPVKQSGPSMHSHNLVTLSS